MPNANNAYAFQLYVLAAAILAIQLVLLAFWTGTVRTLRKAWVNPEDQRTLGGSKVHAQTFSQTTCRVV